MGQISYWGKSDDMKKAKKLKASEFERLCGVRHETFLEMCEIGQAVEEQKRSGRNYNLSVENQVLLTLTFWREYRTLVSFRARLGIAR